MQVKEPTTQTLRKYGYDLPLWRKLLFDQGGACAICRKVPKSGRLVLDHEHAPGWARMPAQERAKYVRGLLCFMPCNRFLVCKNNLDSAERVVQYLGRYEQGRN